jgi:trans-2,3-dihydro-3-hydroxyanthranilate isomerase
MGELSVAVMLVDACLRNGAGGSPTAVVTSCGGLDDVELARIPSRMGTSHVAVVYPHGSSGGSRTLRFFTAEGELLACGHGTVAAIAVLSLQGARQGFQGLLRLAGRDREATGTVQAEPDGSDVVEAWFDQGTVEHRGTTGDELAAFLTALGLERDALHADDAPAVVSPGRARVLIPVLDRTVLASIRPDQERLAAESRRYRQLGCFVYVPPSSGDPAVARMFAPAIGVFEDIANANSTGCLAAHLLITGRNPTIAVDQGDALGQPSTVHATAVRSARGIATRVGGSARVLPETHVIH